MPGCRMHSRPKLAENARYNSLLKISKQQEQQQKANSACVGTQKGLAKEKCHSGKHNGAKCTKF